VSECSIPLVGGVAGGAFYRRTKEDVCRIYVSIGNSDWIHKWSADEVGDIQRYFTIDEIIDPKPGPALYEYYVKYEFCSEREPTDAGINEIYMETDVQMSSASLPSLSVGANEIVYRDDTKRPHSVQITHGWRESSEASPPLPPANSISPSDGAHMELGLLRKLRWEAARCPDGDSIADYHIQISPRADVLHPISPSFDRITFSRNPEWDIPQGWLLRGRTYFWRVGARNGSGVWSPWSQVWRFCVDQRCR
jgi:hypothetical protein